MGRKNRLAVAIAADISPDARRSIDNTDEKKGSLPKDEIRKSPDAFYREAIKKPSIRRLMERLATA